MPGTTTNVNPRLALTLAPIAAIGAAGVLGGDLQHAVVAVAAYAAYLAAGWWIRPDPNLGALHSSWNRILLASSVLLLPGYALAEPLVAVLRPDP